MKTDTREQMLKYIKENDQVRVNQLVKHFEITQAAIHRHLNKLIASGNLEKNGRPPRVYYSNIIREDQAKYISGGQGISFEDEQIIQSEFIYISPMGKINRGIEGFRIWCEKFGLDISKTAVEYVKTIDKYNKFKKDGYIDGLQKLRHTFKEVFLTEVYYLDFYSIERFGKTKLGSLTLYAKQSQNLPLIKEVVEISRERIYRILINKKIDAVCFIPHTLPRKIQFMNEVRKLLDINLPHIILDKVVNQVPVAQKTLNRLEDRIENARSTIFVRENVSYKRVLLIDDAIGSGATINEVARKLKSKKVANEVIALGLTGSYKGFEVLNEV